MGHQRETFQLTKTMKTLFAILAFLASSDGFVLTDKLMQSAPNSLLSNAEPSSMEAALPEKMTVTLTMLARTVKLHLTKSLNVQSDFPVIVAYKGTFSNWTQNSKKFAAYSDVTNNASIIVEIKKKNNELVKTCRGTLSIDGQHYSLSPRDDGLLDINAAGEISVQIDGVDHVMHIENATMDFSELLHTGTPVPHSNVSLDPGAWPSGFQRYVVEVCLFIDYALYQRWYSRSQAYDHWGRYSDAFTNLVYYFVHVANGVDMRYSSIKQSDYSINVRLVGLVIAASPSDSPWTESFRVNYGSETFVHMYKALDSFEKWLPNQVSRIGFSFDQATLFTGYNMYDGNYCSNGPCAKSGLADIDSICQLSAPVARAAAICKEAGAYASINTWAHELGHNLGAYHDGTGNGCNSADQYLMAVSPGELTSNNFNNPFTFSSCSMWYFRNTLAQITMKGKGNCLFVGSSAPTVAVPPNFAPFPGMQYSADQQCQNIFGSASYYCGGGSKDETICRAMECWVPSKRTCFVTIEQRAADGTKCANRKWCMNGQCVFDPRAAPAPDTCIYGDYKDLIDTGSGNRMSCYDMGRLQPHRCYDNRTSADCCQTCATIRDLSKPANCYYGDKDPDYCRSRAKRSNCYDKDFANNCCDYCSKQKKNTFGCEYGDRVDWCSNSAPYSCYDSISQCCETCQRYYNGNAPVGCEYGDRAPWCSTTTLTKEHCSTATGQQCCASCSRIVPGPAVTDKANWCSGIFAGQCYDSNTASTCPATCGRHRRSNPICAYGNRYEWCKAEFCNTYRNDCCDVCL